MADEVLDRVGGGGGERRIPHSSAVVSCATFCLSGLECHSMLYGGFCEEFTHAEKEGVPAEDAFACPCDVTVGSPRRLCAASGRNVEGCFQCTDSMVCTLFPSRHIRCHIWTRSPVGSPVATRTKALLEEKTRNHHGARA